MNPTDLRRFHDGDELLFDELVGTHSPRLLQYLRRFEGPDVGADDLLQECWLRAYRKRRTFAGTGSLVGWLFSVARTVGLAAASQRARRTAPIVDSAPLGPNLLDRISLRDALTDAVLALPERQREVVLLRIVEGQSTGDTAERLRCAEGTVKATLHQAMQKLRELLREEGS